MSCDEANNDNVALGGSGEGSESEEGVAPKRVNHQQQGGSEWESKYESPPWGRGQGGEQKKVGAHDRVD